MKDYECPDWCRFKDAPVEEFEGLYRAPKHENYAGGMQEDPADPYAPEHESIDFVDLQVHEPETEKYATFAVEVRLRQIDEGALELHGYADGGGAIWSDASAGARDLARHLELAALRLRGLAGRLEGR